MFWILRIVIGGIFAFSGFMKLIHPYQNFLAVIQSYDILSVSAAQILAKGLPWIELVFGVFLVLGLWTRFSLYINLLMNLTFVGVLSQCVLRKLPIGDCGCFGGVIELKPWQTLVMDLGIALILLTLIKFISQTKKFGLDRFFDHD